MRILVTSSRFPHALDLIRKFGMEGHTVWASDTFRTSPGNHSKYVHESVITASPKFEPLRFLGDVESLVHTHGIQLIVPAFEEGFVLARHAERFSNGTSLFCPPFDTLARLHKKHTFVELCGTLGIATPETKVVTSPAELRAAIDSFDQYFARASFSRGGVEIVTNAGPLAGVVPVDAVEPSVEHPWIVQRFVQGRDVCSFSVAQHGRVVAHSTYIHPKTIEHAGGISFESVEMPETLAITSRIVEATGYHGQISMDYLETPDGFRVVECNPRPTAGVSLMDSRELVRAILDPPPTGVHVVPAGVRLQIVTALIRDMLRDRHNIPEDLRAILSGVPDVYLQPGDVMPGIYQALSYSHVFAFRHKLHRGRSHSDLVAAQFYDIAWDGEPIP